MIIILFWSSVGFIVYTYILFPVLVLLRGLLWHRPYQSAEITPTVSLIIAAYNEESNIGTKLENILSLDYPYDQLEVIVASDGSDDSTNAIVNGYVEHGIRLLSLPRQGKASALNAAFEASTGEILVFSDANSMYAPDALCALMRPFADPQVGGVAGNQHYLSEHSTKSTTAGEYNYWNFDRLLKKFQSQAGNTISATGAIYAIRRSLFHPVPAGVTDDFVTSTRVIAQGYRLVFAPDALAYEPVVASSGAEFRRKVRVITRGLHAVWVMRQLLNPFRHGLYALQLFSHKVLRRLVVFPLIILFLISPFLWQKSLFYQIITLAQIVFYSIGTLGMLFKRIRFGQTKFFTIPFYFCMVNAAALLATMNVLRGQQINRWEPQRQKTSESGGTNQVTTAPLSQK